MNQINKPVYNFKISKTMSKYRIGKICFYFFFYYLQAISGECGFLAANLYAKSIFGEDALANLSIEKPIEGGPDAVVIGHIRIRAKSQVNYFDIDFFFFFIFLFFFSQRKPGLLLN